MSIAAKRMFLVFGSILLLATTSIVAASIVGYKPWGVHDLQRDEYDQIIAKIDKRASLEGTPRPISSRGSVVNPTGICLTGTNVETVVVFINHGDRTLEYSAPENWPASLKPLDQYPVQVEPRGRASLRFQWEVPTQTDDLSQLKFKLRTNDPLMEEVEIEPSCEIAKPFLLAKPSLGASQSTTQTIQDVNYVFSQTFDDFVIIETDADPRLVIDVEPVVDQALLAQHQAKSGLQISVTDPPGRRRGSYSFPIAITAMNDGYSEKLSFDFAMRRRSSTTFFGPELDIRAGLQMGVIEVGSEEQWTFFARMITEKPLSDIEIEVQPEIFVAELALARKGSTDYRITLRLKPDAKPVDFQVKSKGYVKLSSKEDPSIDHGIPLRGTLIQSPNKG